MSKRPGIFRAALLNWLGVPITPKDGDFWGQYFGLRYGNANVNAESVLRLSTGWACVRLISETVATLPLGFYRRKADGSREIAADHALYELLHNQPNASMTAVQFWEAMVASMLLHGRAYAEKRFLGGRIVAIDFLLPASTVRNVDYDGRVTYRYYSRNGYRDIANDAIIDIPAFTLDGVTGLTPIGYARRVFGAAQAAEDAAETIFSKGLRAAGFLKNKNLLKPDQRNRLRDQLKKFTAGGEEEGSIFVLENDADFSALTMNPEDAQMLQTRAFSVEEICRFYRVPPWMVGHTEKSTSWGTGMEQQMIGFSTFTLRPWLSRIEQAIRRSLLTPVERLTYFAEFAVEGLLRADSAGRAAFYSTMTQNGIYTRDECRQKENLPRMGGNADVLTVQANMLPLDALAQQQAPADAAAARNAVRAWLGLDDVLAEITKE